MVKAVWMSRGPDHHVNLSRNRAALNIWTMTDSLWNKNETSRLSPIILRLSISKNSYAESFFGPRVSTAIERNGVWTMYAVESSEYFWRFLVLSVLVPPPRFVHNGVWPCCAADDCHIPGKQFTWPSRNVCHSVQAFAISEYKADWFLCGRDARWHQSTCH